MTSKCKVAKVGKHLVLDNRKKKNQGKNKEGKKEEENKK